MDFASTSGLIELVFDNAPALVGLVLPVLISYLNRGVHKANERFIVTIIACLGVSTVLKWQDLVYGDPGQVLASAGVIFAESQIVYKTYFEKSALNLRINPPVSESPSTEALSNFKQVEDFVVPQVTNEKGSGL